MPIPMWGQELVRCECCSVKLYGTRWLKKESQCLLEEGKSCFWV
jgi:hypothetical protein